MPDVSLFSMNFTLDNSPRPKIEKRLLWGELIVCVDIVPIDFTTATQILEGRNSVGICTNHRIHSTFYLKKEHLPDFKWRISMRKELLQITGLIFGKTCERLMESVHASFSIPLSSALIEASARTKADKRPFLLAIPFE